MGPNYEEGRRIEKMIKEEITLEQLTSILVTSMGDEVLSKQMKFTLKFCLKLNIDAFAVMKLTILEQSIEITICHKATGHQLLFILFFHFLCIWFWYLL